MADREPVRGDGIDFVTIATPNSSHYEIAKYFMEKNIHVLCDKPVTMTVEEAEDQAAAPEAAEAPEMPVLAPIVMNLHSLNQFNKIRYRKYHNRCKWMDNK